MEKATTKTEETKEITFSKNGLMDKKQRNEMEFWKGRQKENKEK